MSTPNKCQHCGASKCVPLFPDSPTNHFDCDSFIDPDEGFMQSAECRWRVKYEAERSAHAATKLELENTKTDLELAKMSITTLKNRVEELEAQIRQDNRKQAQADAKEWDLEEGWKDHERFQP